MRRLATTTTRPVGPPSVSGSGYAGVSSYVNSLSYRAFGLKQMSYANGRTLSVQYDNRMRPTQWSIPGVLRMQYSYTWELSGRLSSHEIWMMKAWIVGSLTITLVA